MRAWSFLVRDLADITPFQEFPNNASSTISALSQVRQKLVSEAASTQAKLLNASPHCSVQGTISSERGFFSVALCTVGWGRGVVSFFPFPAGSLLFIPYSSPKTLLWGCACAILKLWPVSVILAFSCTFSFWGVISFVLHLSLPCVLISSQSPWSLFLSLLTGFNSVKCWEFCWNSAYFLEVFWRFF